ncbi:hypothetical protein [Candidatus Chloroploca asiatica]|uniref:Uncharacterized protein n=1 Tax=Candidatus Chloroploca asiatica TaxID=1506545 RepID=A0A2H3L8J7_9CHLR|nr:hypothetical protein [Candidatus Chloroploca asiatica]PDV98620.1 hypothetical protein A9Q02_14635 [Candidatus Chloroploca asiatica]
MDWLFSEAGVGWIVAIGALIGWISTYIRRERPSRIVIQELETLQLLDIHPSQQGKIVIQYTDNSIAHPIRNLVQKKVVIYNSGTQDIVEPVTFSVPIKGGDESSVGIFGFVKAISENTEFTMVPEKSDNDQIVNFKITLEHINSVHKHGNHITVFFLTEEFFDFNTNRLTGKGWSIQFAKRKRLKMLRDIADALYFSFIVILGFVFLVSLVVILYTPLLPVIQSNFNISEDNPIFGVIALIIFGIPFFTMRLLYENTKFKATRFIADKISVQVLNYPPLNSIEDIVLN